APDASSKNIKKPLIIKPRGNYFQNIKTEIGQNRILGKEYENILLEKESELISQAPPLPGREDSTELTSGETGKRNRRVQ
ncbi:hypothetical protein NPIL_357561, partial [Nephila pilipes]